jgi:uncharacterized protein YcaQ
MPILEILAAGKIPEAWQPIGTTTAEEVVFLSPLEYVSARGRAKKLFDFEYIWEIYKPDDQRRWGPYTLPILYGDRLVARMDAKLDRVQSELIVNGFWFEEWFEPGQAFYDALARGLARLDRFLNVVRVNLRAVEPDSLRNRIGKSIGN